MHGVDLETFSDAHSVAGGTFAWITSGRPLSYPTA